jgi:hypothetical protein
MFKLKSDHLYLSALQTSGVKGLSLQELHLTICVKIFTENSLCLDYVAIFH